MKTTMTFFSVCCRVLLSTSVFVVMATQSAFAQTPRPSRMPSPAEIDKLDSKIKKSCEAHFPTGAQELTKTACYLGAVLKTEKGFDAAVKECTKVTSRHSRPEVACKIGAMIANDIGSKADAIAARLKICQDHYPNRTDADSFLQESCVIGTHLAADQKKPKLQLCQDISKDTVFVAACGSGISLAQQASQPKAPPANEQNRACLRFFDPTSFHQGYRACLGARALSLEWDGKANQVAKQCRRLSASKGGDTEAAACIVGGGLLHALNQVPRQENMKFRNCGDNKVKWDEREYLVCLMAASLLDIGAPKDARNACKEIFGGRRNGLRNDCYRSVDTLTAQGNKPGPVPTPHGTISNKPDDSDLWPDAPDVPPEEAEADDQPAEEGANFPAGKILDQIEREPVSVEAANEGNPVGVGEGTRADAASASSGK